MSHTTLIHDMTVHGQTCGNRSARLSRKCRARNSRRTNRPEASGAELPVSRAGTSGTPATFDGPDTHAERREVTPERIQFLRERIARGEYLDDAKLDAAIEKLAAALLGS